MTSARHLISLFAALTLVAGCSSSNSGKPDAGTRPDAAVNADGGGGADAGSPDADVSVDATPTGDLGTAGDVVVNEVNWAGCGGDASDEWIELFNTTDAEIDVSGWQVQNAGSGTNAVTLPYPTIISARGYLVIGTEQGPDTDTNRTSLTGVADVVVMTLSLDNAGEPLVLKDYAGTTIDETPSGSWAAGNATVHYSMERRDDNTGGGYGDGTASGSWYTWSSLDGTVTTNADADCKGTPGAVNTNPDIFDHMTLVATPNPPSAGVDFTLTATAYSSTDDSIVITNYNGTVGVTASSGALTGDTTGTVTSGVATLTLQNDTVASGVMFTVTDSIYPGITGTLTADVRPEGDTATARDVVISELNWYGNGSASSDEWIELRNTTGADLNLAGWTIEGATTGGGTLTLPSGTVIAAGGYLVVADQQGADTAGSRTSVTGVTPVVVDSSISLSNNPSVALVLKDIAATTIDATPDPTTNGNAWAAGSSSTLESMERRDDITGGGYTDGTAAGAWYTWNRYGKSDTTNADTADHGTPGAANSDPNAKPTTIYSTGFESAYPNFELVSGTAIFSNTPPAGTAARTGFSVATLDSITMTYTGRQMQSVECIQLPNATDPLVVDGWAEASSNNGGNGLFARWQVLWFTDNTCATAASTAKSGVTAGTALVEGSYTEITGNISPPSDATYFKLVFEIKDDNGGANSGDDWALDDVVAGQ